MLARLAGARRRRRDLPPGTLPPPLPPAALCREEGVAGLWKGLGPNIARNAIINAAELASYDQIKQSMLASGMPVRRRPAAGRAAARRGVGPGLQL